jgi:drug/metabolite transporter (DMT)-like permease
VTAVLAVLFVGCWSSGFIGAKLGAGEAPVPTVLMWRFLPLALLLLPPALLHMRRTAAPSSRELTRHSLIGLLSQSAYLLTVYGAIGLGVSAGTTALVDGVQPLVAAALVGPLLGVAVGRGQWVGLGLGLAGVVVVSWSDATSPATEAPAWAYLVPLVGMLSLVGSTFLERRAPVLTPPRQALAIHCTTSAALFTAIAVLTGNAAPPATAQFWFATAWLVVLPTFGGYGLYWFLVARIGVTPVNGLMFLIAPVTSVWGAAMFGEPLTVLTVVGLSLALVGAVAAGRRVRPPVRGCARLPPSPSPRAGQRASHPRAGPRAARTRPVRPRESAPPRHRPGCRGPSAAAVAAGSSSARRRG